MAITDSAPDVDVDRDRKTLNEILITGIIFGLTLNLISDFITSFPTIINNPPLLFWSGAWTVGSLIATLFLFYRLSYQYLGDESSLKKEYRIVIIWDIEEGTIAHRNTGYRPQLFARDFISELDDKHKAEIEKIVKSSPDSLRDSGLPLKYAEMILLNGLTRSTIVGRKIYTSKGIREILGDKNRFAIPSLLDSKLFLLGNWMMKYEPSKNGISRFEIVWKSPYNGKLSFEIEAEKVDWFRGTADEQLAFFDDFYRHEFGKTLDTLWGEFPKVDPYVFPKGMMPKLSVPEDGPTNFIRTDMIVRFHAKFSPIRMQFGWGNTKVLVPWVKGTLATLHLLIDWHIYLQAIRIAKEAGM